MSPSKQDKKIQTETAKFVLVCIFFEERAIYDYFYKRKYSHKNSIAILFHQNDERTASAFVFCQLRNSDQLYTWLCLIIVKKTATIQDVAVAEEVAVNPRIAGGHH